MLTVQSGDLVGNLITSAAEVPGLIFSLFLIHYVSRKLAFAIPMGLIPVPLIPLMAGEGSSSGRSSRSSHHDNPKLSCVVAACVSCCLFCCFRPQQILPCRFNYPSFDISRPICVCVCALLQA